MQRISPNVWMWSEIHGETRDEPYPWNSFVINVPYEGVVALVDPLPIADDDLREVERIGQPSHIVLTCEYHLRNSEKFRERWGCKILANEAELDRYEVELGGTFKGGESLWHIIDLIFVPDLYFPETALLVKESGGVLIVGDILSGGRMDMGIPEGEIGIIAPNYIRDLGAARQSLSSLLDLSFSTICFGHGHPVLVSPKEKLRAYLEDDRVWDKLRQDQIGKPARRAD